MKVKKRYKYLARVGSNFRKIFIFFGRNSSLHGFNHLLRENVILLARLFWLTILVVSGVCLYQLIAHNVVADDELIYFAPDTRYLEWTTSFPAVTICEQTNIKNAQKKLVELYPDLLRSLPYAHQRYVTELMYGRGTCSRTLCSPCGEFVPCDVPWRNVMENVHKKCEELITDCAYNGVEFSCCETFLPADSEYGPCFTFNALQNVEYTKEALYAVNRTTGPGVLTFLVISDADIALHSNEELATNILSEKYKFPLRLLVANSFEILFSVVEIQNDPALFDAKITERKCRFVNEIPDDDKIHTYSVYSHGACSLALSTKHVFEHCGCISPLRDPSYKNYYCNYTGMVCLTEHEVLKNKLGLDTVEEEGDCLPSCVESELHIKHDSMSVKPEYTGGMRVKIEMAALPTLRYQRNLLRTNLDLVVSVGGMAGLFFGASVLSVIEIFYLIMRKPNS